MLFKTLDFQLFGFDILVDRLRLLQVLKNIIFVLLNFLLHNFIILGSIFDVLFVKNLLFLLSVYIFLQNGVLLLQEVHLMRIHLSVVLQIFNSRLHLHDFLVDGFVASLNLWNFLVHLLFAIFGLIQFFLFLGYLLFDHLNRILTCIHSFNALFQILLLNY